ncbi:MAG: DUF2442 domain-containing protein [Gemmatimonadales bacterium]|jgi:hypothetical protein
MLYDVVAVETRPDFKVWVRFENGVEGEADLSDLAGQGVFKRWTENPEEFDKASVDAESGTVMWPGGLDVAPDRLYSEVLRSRGGVGASAEV